MPDPYQNAKNWRQTQADIAALLSKYGIGDVQWSTSTSQSRAALSFAKTFPDVARRNVRASETKRIVVQIAFPFPAEGRSLNAAFRVLFWYLKSKLEAIAFAFEDGTEMFNFEREFFGHVMIEDANGRPAAAYDAFKSAAISLSPVERVIALPGGKP